MHNGMTGVWFAIISVAACSGFWASAPQPADPETGALEFADECDCECECEAELEELSVCLEQKPTEQPRPVKVITRAIEVHGPAKKCAAKPPDIKPVKNTAVYCEPGYFCLDEKNWVNLLNNELAYRAWIADVRECEQAQ